MTILPPLNLPRAKGGEIKGLINPQCMEKAKSSAKEKGNKRRCT
ncbi:hypothetical protein [Helicobacter sp. T3_23-1059]